MSEAQTVFVATYEHRHGTVDQRVFKTHDAACNWKAELAEENWDDQFPEEEKPAREDIGDAYFELMNAHMGEEFFSVNEVDLED